MQTKRVPVEPSPGAEVFTLEEAAGFMKMSLRQLWDLNAAGVGPEYIKYGKQYRYMKTDCIQWLRKMRGQDLRTLINEANSAKA